MTDFQSSPETETVPELKRVEMLICTACLDGIGEGCHTPGCSMFLHIVDLPFPKDTYREVTDFAQSPLTQREADALNERVKLQAEMIERYGKERDEVARAIFGDGRNCCANLGPYVRGTVNELNEARKLNAFFEECYPAVVEKWRATEEGCRTVSDTSTASVAPTSLQPYAVEYRIERDGHLYSYMHAGQPPEGARDVRWLYLADSSTTQNTEGN